MPSFMKLYDRKYLGAWDLEEAPGKTVTVTIENLDKRMVFVPEKNAEESRVTMGFVGKKKRFVCNITNAKRIGALHGADYAGWPGKRITLTVAKQRNGKVGIVVKDEIPPAKGKDTDERDMTHTGAQPENTVTPPPETKP